MRRSAPDEPPSLADAFQADGDAMLRFFLRRTFDAQVALDLTAEVFARAFERRAQLSGRTPEQTRAWLFAIAQRELVDHHRRGRARRRALDRLGLDVPAYSAEDLQRVEEVLTATQQHPALAGELERLPAAQREAVLLRVVEQLSYAEVAERLQITETAVRARVSRGLSALRLALTPATGQEA